MGRFWLNGLALGFLCVVLVGCMPKGSTVVPSADSTPLLATLATQPTSAPAETQQPSPSSIPTATPAPTVTPQLWTPGPLATPGKEAYAAAAQGSVYSDFVILQQNGLQGLVRADGHQILPCRFALVEPIDFQWDNFSGGLLPVHNKPLFFVVPIHINLEGQHDYAAVGWLCDNEGRQLNKGMFNHVYFIGSGVLWAYKGESDGIQTINSTILDDNGRVLFCGQYDSVFMVGERIYAGSRARQKTDVYSDRGKKLFTTSMFIEIVDMLSQGNGKYIETFSSPNGGQGVTLWNSDLKVLFTADSDINWLCDNRFRAMIDDGTGVVDAEGKPVVPPNYDDVTLFRDEGKDYLCAQGGKGCALYDLEGKLLYQSQDYKWLDVTDGRLIAHFENSYSSGRVLGLDGHDLLGRDDVREWLPDAHLYHCMDMNGTDIYLREDGSELPLPKKVSIWAMSADRFLVTFVDDMTGLYDSMGKVVIPAVGNLDPAGLPGVLIYNEKDHDRTMQWLLDYNGNRLWSQPMDSIEYSGKKDLFWVRQDDKHGLMKLDGNWLWSASDYQELQD